VRAFALRNIPKSARGFFPPLFFPPGPPGAPFFSERYCRLKPSVTDDVGRGPCDAALRRKPMNSAAATPAARSPIPPRRISRRPSFLDGDIEQTRRWAVQIEQRAAMALPYAAKRHQRVGVTQMVAPRSSIPKFLPQSPRVGATSASGGGRSRARHAQAKTAHRHRAPVLPADTQSRPRPLDGVERQHIDEVLRPRSSAGSACSALLTGPSV